MVLNFFLIITSHSIILFILFCLHLSVASGIEDLEITLGLSEENVNNLRIAFQAAREGDERPLLAMHMPERSWHEVQYMLQQLLDSGFSV